jgi:hypothetical protein
MNTIPLVKGNTQEEINTSLIALKKALDEMNSSSGKTDASVQSQIKQINELIENINTHLDTVDEQITDLQPVDTVTSGNMQSVTSNAVAKSCVKFPDYSKPINVGPEGAIVYSWNATKDCFVQFIYWTSGATPLHLLINHNIVSVCDTNNGTVSQFSGYVKNGDNIIFSNDSNINRPNILRLFELQP